MGSSGKIETELFASVNTCIVYVFCYSYSYKYYRKSINYTISRILIITK